ADDMERFLAAGGNVCLCPLTEANLGDGLAAVAAIRRQGGRICVGSDSNLRLSMLEELRWLEYGQRLRGMERGVVRDEQGRVTRALLEMATRHGARALGVRAGAIEPEKLADFCLVDLEHPSLAGATAETLLDTLVFGAGNETIVATCVGGVWAWHR
ncbi:MAG: amidohydrolase family protein, partial [Phycisphaerae bacterium]|nr:amidohydrolase family protein [Phycisphaerae bacterium]